MATTTVSPVVKAFKTGFTPQEIGKDKEGQLAAKVEETREHLEEVRKQLGSYGQFFTFEGAKQELADVRDDLEEKLKAAEEKLAAEVLRKARIHKHIGLAAHGYDQQIDPIFLSWARKDTTPMFIVLPVILLTEATMGRTDNVFQMTIAKGERLEIEPGLPNLLEEQFEKLAPAIWKKHATGSDRKLVLSAENRGIMPAKTREAVVNALASKLFDRLFVVVEAPKWEVSTYPSPTITDDDPLVVGWVKETQQLFIIAIYNPTPAEQYVADTFAFSSNL